MKVNTINEKYQPRAQNICEYQISKQASNVPKNKGGIYPQDRIETSSTVKQAIQLVSNKQVELNYSLHDKKVSAEVINENGERVKVKGENLPKELKQINNPAIFKAFLNSAYAKVSTLSNGNYKLDVNQKLLGGMWQEEVKEAKTNTKIEEANQVIQLDLNKVFIMLSQIIGDSKVFTQEYIISQFTNKADNETQKALIELKKVDKELLYSEVNSLQFQLDNIEMILCGLDAIL